MTGIGTLTQRISAAAAKEIEYREQGETCREWEEITPQEILVVVNWLEESWERERKWRAIGEKDRETIARLSP